MNNQEEVDALVEMICNNYSNEELEWADKASTICTTELDKKSLSDTIQEFYDNAFHPDIKPEISDEAKAVALKYMILFWNENSKTKIGGEI